MRVVFGAYMSYFYRIPEVVAWDETIRAHKEEPRAQLPRGRVHHVPVFSFPAEDGIRDGRVTGVQTCALPICSATPSLRVPATPMSTAPAGTSRLRSGRAEPTRSEERRVGKEGQSGRSPVVAKKQVQEVGYAGGIRRLHVVLLPHPRGRRVGRDDSRA